MKDLFGIMEYYEYFKLENSYYKKNFKCGFLPWKFYGFILQ
jgi:hypothetical protein